MREVRRATDASRPGSRSASTTWGRVGAGSRAPWADRVAWPSAASMAARSRGTELATEAGHGQGRGQGGPVSAGTVLGGGARTPGLRPGVERVEPHRAAGAKGHRTDAPGLGQGPVLALRVHHPGMAAEHRLAPQVGLHERTLAPADLTEHHGVGIGDHPVPVEDERVVDEGATQYVPADEHAMVAEPGLADQRIGRTQVTGGGDMGGDPRGQTGHERPRPSGRLQAKAVSCSPKSRRSSIRAWPAACSRAARAALSSARLSAVTVT